MDAGKTGCILSFFCCTISRGTVLVAEFRAACSFSSCMCFPISGTGYIFGRTPGVLLVSVIAVEGFVN